MQLGLLDLAGQVQVVSTVFAHGHAHARAVHFFIALQRRVLAHQVAALNQHIGRGKSNALAAHRVDRKKAHVRLLGGHRIDRFAGRIKGHQGQTHAQAARQFGGQVDRDTFGLTGCCVFLGQDGVAQIDRGTQRAGGGELRGNGRHGLRESKS